jgi:hypothetical protein
MLSVGEEVSSLLLWPGFGFGDGVPGKRTPLPQPSDLEAFRAFILQLFPGPASVPATGWRSGSGLQNNALCSGHRDASRLTPDGQGLQVPTPEAILA